MTRRRNKIDSYLDQLHQGSANPDIQIWAASKLKRMYDKKRLRSSIGLVPGIASASDAPYTCLVKQYMYKGHCTIEMISQIIGDQKLSILRSYGVVVATYNNGKYYGSYGDVLSGWMRNHIRRFLRNRIVPEFHVDKLTESLSKVDMTNPKIQKYSAQTKDKFWHIEFL
jgi:hypothetical protein